MHTWKTCSTYCSSQDHWQFAFWVTSSICSVFSEQQGAPVAYFTHTVMHVYSMCVRGSHVTSVIGGDWVYLTVCFSLFCPLNLIVLFSFPFHLFKYSMSSAIQIHRPTFARTRLTAFFPFTLQREINDYFTIMLLAAFITILIQSAAWCYC